MNMMSMKWLSLLLLLQLTCYFCSGSCGKVLVWPVEYSHWMNMKIILDELAMRGHEVTVLTSSASIFIDLNKPSAIKFENFSVSLTKDDFENALKHFVTKWTELTNSFWFQMLNEKKWDQFYSEVLGRPTTLLETMEKAEFWLFRSYWDFEYPCPLLPNVEFIGGLHCKPAKPLPKEIEEFVQSSGENGIVVFTLGSMVTNMTEERANMIASALAEIPQKVLWRHDGKKPDTLGPNTRLYKWVPQNDLLGHPKTKAFITHGGTNGIYEAIYHGVPMVGLPVFAEQPDNINRVKAKGAAVRLDLETMSKTDFLNALKQVINNPSYKQNAMWLSTIQRDQPIKPLDRAVFWIEFVMRHKGAKYLRPAAHKLTWFQYHSLDVIGFLLACVAVAVFVITKCFLFCCRKFAERGMKRKRE
ncbi:UDP-glucuronosyltransferase 2B31-like isoform X5 [Capricornis sumatraensis]|uniref:UDP-glucuronosyltransferase 2B31-like isoform X5 n=1 Tax=Capricornis sumatraensis TaxID=34865 RepID=UPI003605093C